MLKWLILGSALVLLALGGWLLFSAKPETGTRPSVLLEAKLWQSFKNKFVESGRVVDRYNHNISHSEGQGYGMLLAEAAGDRKGFDTLWEWTSHVLRRNDGLFSWRYDPCPTQDRRCITDTNNAADGEILIAWALLRAAKRWNAPHYLAAAKQIAETTMNLSTITRDEHRFILPGKTGFVENEAITLNPSYWVFPALEAFATEGWYGWDQVIRTGNWLVKNGAFGPYSLPPDWVDFENGSLQPSKKFDPVYGFNAVRVLLHLAWSDEGVRRGELEGYEAFWSSYSPPPAWIRLDTEEKAGFGWLTGMEAIARLARAEAAGESPATGILPRPREDDDYFSWALTLLCQVAATEKSR